MKSALAVIVFLVGAGSALGQPRPDPCPSTSNPSDATLQLSLTGGQHSFHEGEIVGLTMGFAGTTPGKYFFDTRNYDRSGRLDSEIFCVDSPAGRDPLEDFFKSGIGGGGIGGGIGGTRTLTADPITIGIELNEWRILPAGHYRLRVISSRVSRAATATESGSGTRRVSLSSNTVEFEITLAPIAWQAAQLAAAVAALDVGVDDDTKRRGARMLRFLNSEAAARELSRRFWSLNGEPFGWDFMFGLIATPHRQIAIDAMTAAIADPNHPITTEFLNALSLLEIQAEGKYPVPEFSQETRDSFQKTVSAKRAAYQQLVSHHLAELFAAIDAKIDRARAVSLDTLQANPAVGDRDRLRGMLISSWDSLPGRTRNELIQYRWDAIRGPEMLPLLRQIVDTPPMRTGGADRPDRAAALSRLYELSPDEGRERILREMIDPKGGIGIQVLGRLPDRELPQIEAPILAKFRQGNGGEVDYQLIDRYATKNPLVELKTIYESARGRWACTQQAALLRYFLRVEEPYGVAEIANALRERRVTGCYQSLFGDLRDALSLPPVERLAIAALDDASPEVVRNAAEALGAQGSPAAEAPLWRRLEKFHENSKNRSDELRVRPGVAPTVAAENMVEYALMNALLRGEAWICYADKLDHLKAIVSPSRQPELQSLIEQWRSDQFALSITWLSDGRVHYSIAAYSGDSIDRLVRKLKEFPSSARVTLSISADVASRHQDEIAAVQQAARSAGFVFEIKSGGIP